jgi:hypothetical protein
MNYIDLIILVIANTGEGYYCDFINEYWAKFIKFLEKNGYNIKIFLLFGHGNNIKNINVDEKNIIIANHIEERFYPGILQKTIYGLDYINSNYNYKHILRTNLSSFFILNELIKINNRLPDLNVYAGVCTPTFVSGAGFWLSKDNVEYILNNRSNINFGVMDDVSIGELLKSFNKTELPRYDVCDISVFIDIQSILPQLVNQYHIRVKSINRNVDVVTMKNLTKHFYSL